MKKYLLLTLLFIILIPFYVYAETCDNEKVYISSIALKNKADSVTELDEASLNNNSINLNLSMANEGDTIEYEVVVNNDSNDDYVIDKYDLNTPSNYVSYRITSSDDSNVIKANSNKLFMIDIDYSNRLSDSDYASGEFNEYNEMVVSLLNYNSDNHF